MQVLLHPSTHELKQSPAHSTEQEMSQLVAHAEVPQIPIIQVLSHPVSHPAPHVPLHPSRQEAVQFPLQAIVQEAWEHVELHARAQLLLHPV
jgi:hypothetical protein